MARPGFLIPVFFLSFFLGSAQTPLQESAVIAAGGCFASRKSSMDGAYNQAALGWVSESTLSMHHAQPFMIEELGVSTLSFQCRLQRGGFGTTLSTFGIDGLRHISSWTGYGLRLSPGYTAGLGLYFQDFNAGESGHHYGLGCALGIQMSIGENLILGVHVKHPFSWVNEPSNSGCFHMMLSTGLSYSFFRTATYHSDLHASISGKLRWSHGLEMKIKENVSLLLGVYTAPSTISGGISMNHGRWKIAMAFVYCFDNGFSPTCSLSFTIV